MLRSVLLLAGLLVPIGALGQTLNTIPAAPFSKAMCDGTTPTDLTVYWGMATGTVMPTSGTYRIMVSTTSECPAAESTTAKALASGVSPDTTTDSTGLTSQRYPLAANAGALTVQSLVAKVGAACSDNPTVYMCVQLLNASSGVAAQTGVITLKVESGPPAVPVNVQVAPGNEALNVSWSPGPDNGVTPAQYYVEVGEVIACPAGTTGVCVATPLAATLYTAATHARVAGLVNGVEYAARVSSIATSNAQSAPSSPAVGTPIPTYDFWTSYQRAGGQDTGGCGGGPAGALSLLAVAGLLALRRRS